MKNQLTISIQGKIGSFHDEVKDKLFGTKVDILPRMSFDEVFCDLDEKNADYGIVAIENSLVGSINEVYDLLRIKQHMIVAEHYQRIKLCLVGLEKVELSQIRNLYSHPMALMQAEDYIKNNLKTADIHERSDTAEAVEFVKSQEDILSVAIASRKAAKIHDLKVIVKGLEKDKNNYTRFIALKPKDKLNIDNLNKAKKTSIILELANKPGSLFDALKTFKDENVNLSKIESRPIVGKKWRYYFYLDYEEGINSKKSKKILKNLEKKGNNLRILGSYKQDEVIA